MWFGYSVCPALCSSRPGPKPVQDCAVPLLQLNFARKKLVITFLKIPVLAKSQIPTLKANEVENKSQRAS